MTLDGLEQVGRRTGVINERGCHDEHHGGQSTNGAEELERREAWGVGVLSHLVQTFA
ncbi:MAG: hypothetical protein ACI9KE_002194 [Polyangiales bacterium]|jgi:hypothetical protein